MVPPFPDLPRAHSRTQAVHVIVRWNYRSFGTTTCHVATHIDSLSGIRVSECCTNVVIIQRSKMRYSLMSLEYQMS